LARTAQHRELEMAMRYTRALQHITDVVMEV
jgi:hypothetical protein